MPLNPAPTIDAGLILVSQRLARTDMSRVAEVTYSLATAGAVDASVAEDAADDFFANFVATFGTILDSEVLIQPTIVRLGDGSDTPFEAVAAGAAVAGGNAELMVPVNCAVLIKKLTALGGKANRGRTYMPFALTATDCSENGTILGTRVTADQTVADTFLAQLATDTTPMIISHRVFNTPLPPHFVTAITVGPLVTSYKVEGQIGTQRRRLGRN